MEISNYIQIKKKLPLNVNLLAVSKGFGSQNIKIIALHIDAFYTNSDNLLIPVMQALRIVSLMQDGESEAANLRLLRSQQKFKN